MKNDASFAELVKEIRPGAGDGVERVSIETASPNLNGVFFFAGDDGVNGKELWRY